MMDKARFLSASVTACAAMLIAGTPVMAQDTAAVPVYHKVELSAGFTPDPQFFGVTSGGSISANGSVSSRCAGYIANAPDVRLHYTSGSFPLIISTRSSGDTTLVVHAPDGRWYCDDDGGESGLNAMVRFNSPQSGRYAIWVGSYRSGENVQADVAISEVSSQ
ncbi:hypothetical protein [Alteraurantiacibacter palmitatis]|uniref:Peptidase S1 n=1 Tax=Alteraurantiacibacter palmitatis TaxID=2054628 RepID=A0ABV7E1C1_9SPHN